MSAYSLLGRWKGGPHNSKFMIFYEDDGTAGAVFRCPGGEEGRVHGIFMDGCRRLKGKCYDPCTGGSKGSAEAINITLDSSGTSWSSDGVRWKGKRYDWHSTKTAKPVASNEIWERLQKPINKQARSDKARQLWESTNDALTNVKNAQRHGLMGQVPPNCIGDPYVDHPKPDPRLLGRNLVCTTSKTGKVGVGTTFSYAQPNCVGDPYLAASERARQDRLKAKAALEDKAPFKPAGQRIEGRRDKFLLAVDSETPGDAVTEMVKKSIADKQLPRAEVVQVKPRNIYTSHQVGTMLGMRTEEGRKHYQYMSSDFSIPQKIRMREIKEWHKKVGDRPSFKCATQQDMKFSSDAEMYAGLWPGGIVQFRGRDPIVLPEGQPAFKPAPETKKDREAGCFHKFPEYMPDPMPERVYKIDNSDKAKWKPTHYAHTTLTKSVTLNKSNLRDRMARAGERIKI